MSLRDLMDGECGRSGSLVHLKSHFVHDHAHKEDGLRHTFPHVDGFAPADADQLVQQFLGETLGNSPQTFRMDSLLQEMREIESAVSLHAPIQAPGIAALATSDPTSLAAEDSSWAEQYLESGKQFEQEPCEAEIWNAPFDKSDELPSEEVYELGFGPQWAREYLESSQPNIDVDENWLEHPLDTNAGNELQETANQLLSTVNDPNINTSRFMKFMKQIGDGEITIDNGEIVNVSTGEIASLDDINDDSHETWVSEYQSKEHQKSGQSNEMADQHTSVSTEENWDEPDAHKEEQVAETADEGNEMNAEEASDYSAKLWNKLQDEWEKIFKNDVSDQQWVSEFSDYYDPYKEYPFEDNNPMKDKANALEEGKKRLEEGDLASAVLCFEAAVMCEPENSEAWELLGISQAENEQDPAAICALKNCLKIEPSNLKALMALAISYTNESYQNQACLVLKEWLRQNKSYSHLVPHDSPSIPKIGMVSSLLTRDAHKEVKDLFIAAARLHPTDNIDPDVQSGLGVLFNLSNEYEKAVDCFKTALQVKPNDSRIWNRLGATLANGERSVEAVEAYDHALQLSPGYIRARYNLGITCLNLGAYKEAAEHLLTALNQQAQAKGCEEAVKSWNAMSDSIWSTLRLVVSLLDRRDLHDAVDSRDLVVLNKAFGLNEVFG